MSLIPSLRRSPKLAAKPVRILSIAGSDSGGGAGIQADIKTITALGGYAMTAVTAITVQNTKGVSGVYTVPIDCVVGQIEAVISDIGVDAIKTGMIPDAAMIEAVFDIINRLAPDVPRIVDPVMVATSGDRLITDDAVEALKAHAIPGSILTPNIPEAETLTGRAIACVDEAMEAGFDLYDLGCASVVVKGGHLDGPSLVNCVIDPDGNGFEIEGPRLDTTNTHGTGCTLASALATLAEQGFGVVEAVARASDYVSKAIAAAPGFGKGAGPLNHGFAVRLATDPEE